MTLLNRYILNHFRRYFSLSLSAFTGLYLLIDFFEKVDDFLEHQAKLSYYFVYFANNIPAIIVQVIPLAVLLGVFLTIGGLSRSNEITAMRSGGVSLWRLTTPLLAVSIGISLLVLAASEYLVPLCSQKVNHTLRVLVKNEQEFSSKRDHIWFREGNTIINIRLAQPEKNALQGVSFFEFDPEFRMHRRLDASEGVWTEGGWTFREVKEHALAADPVEVVGVARHDREEIPLAKTPEDFRMAEPRTEEMGFRDLRALVRKLQAEGYDPTRYRVDMHARLSLPFACVIMAFLGIPFALLKGRGASLALGIAISVGIGITYHILQAMLLAFGYSAVLPPMVAAWAANLLFCLFGIWLLLSARQ